MEGSVNYTHKYRSTDELPTPYIDERYIRYISSIWQFESRVNVFQTLPAASMKNELLRLLTLLSYRQPERPDIISIAVAGFYYASDGDAVVCFCCGLTIKGLRSNDKPVEVHGHLSNRCKFVQQNQGVNRRFFEQTQSEIDIFRRFQFGTRETQEDCFNEFEDSSANVQRISDYTPSNISSEDDQALVKNLFRDRRTQDEIQHILQNSHDTASRTSTVSSDDAGSLPTQVTQAQNITQEAAVSNLQEINDTNTAEDDTLGSGETVDTPNLMTQMERVEVTQQQNIIKEESPSVSNLRRNDNTYIADDDTSAGDDTGPTPSRVTQMKRAQVTQPQNIIKEVHAGDLKDMGTTDTANDYEHVNESCNPSCHVGNHDNTNQLTAHALEQNELETHLEDDSLYIQSEERVGICQPLQNNIMPLIIQPQINPVINKQYMYYAMARALNGQHTTQGYSDCVCCFLCGQDLIKWKTEDEPWVEHVDKSPDCEYVIEIWGKEFVRAVTKGDRDMLQTYKALFKARRLRISNQ